MNVPEAFNLGSASHTGHVRLNNEDDYLLGTLLPDNAEVLLCAVADGMGGAPGGAEASRTALRALGTAVLDGASEESIERRVEQGFRSAATRVFEQANAVPALAGMGTTLTALCLSPGQAHIGHVGDSRLYRLRAGQAVALTVDHAVTAPQNLLTRCIGGGQPTCQPDFQAIETRVGDRFVLLSDGVWSVLEADDVGLISGRGSPQVAAEALVAAALRAGGPDNATAVLVDVLSQSPSAHSKELGLLRGERPDARSVWPQPSSLRPPVWPWLVLSAGIVLASVALMRWLGGPGPWAWLQQYL